MFGSEGEPVRTERTDKEVKWLTRNRKRWGKLRRAEALAALRVLDIGPADIQFLALPDQGLTDLLLRDCNSALTRIAK